ncbi:MAG: alpha-galactosidase, partial [Ktedonobacterales bacterium]|nr:alpha-galactosidase [Ktedonobacterales bacterium]
MRPSRAHAENAMSGITIQRQHQGPNERLTLMNAHLEVHYEHDAQFTLVDRRLPRTRVAGGPLFELAPATGGGKPYTYGVGRAAGDGTLPEPLPFTDAHGSGLLMRRKFSVAIWPLQVTWAMYLYDATGAVRLEMSLRNRGTEPLRLERVFPFVTGTWWGGGTLSLAGQQRDFAAYKNGWQSWSFAGGVPLGREEPRPRLPTLLAWHHPGGRQPRQPIAGGVDVTSEEVALLGAAGKPWALLAGFLSAATWLGQIHLQRRDGVLAACVLLDGHILNPGETVEIPPLLLALGPQRTLLAEYAALVGRELGARQSPTRPTGWCSWYAYFDRVSEEDIHENLAALADTRSMLPLEVAQLDDGYQAAIGDWMGVSERFPHGMAPLAARIRAAGYRPGLWLAPFTVAAGSRLAREHPEWLIADTRGRPAWGGHHWGGTVYGLDTTHPGARAWLRALFTTITREWGYDYLKLDFLASAALLGRRHDPTVPRGQALSEGLALIRETVGEEVFLLGCGCPLLSAVGHVDAMRIGPDSSAHWEPRHKQWPLPFSEGHVAPAMRGALHHTLTRAWMHPALWTNDPDCLLTRDRRTHLTVEMVRAFASAVALTGGMVFLSDRVSRLPVERLELAARLLPPMPERAQPMDYFAWGVPRLVAAEIARPWERWHLAGLFNDTGRAREMALTWAELGLAPGAYHAVEFWSGAYLGRSEVGARVRVRPHGAAVLAIHLDIDEPRLLSTSFHVTQGAAELAEWTFDRERQAVRWRIHLGRHATGTMTLWVPAPWQPRALASTARKVQWH